MATASPLIRGRHLLREGTRAAWRACIATTITRTAMWAAGPLTTGSNFCHGPGGNGHAFPKLYQRPQGPLWLERARAFAMHGIAQTGEDAVRHGQMRHSLWAGDPGFAIYLRDCVRGKAIFPTVDVFCA